LQRDLIVPTVRKGQDDKALLNLVELNTVTTHNMGYKRCLKQEREVEGRSCIEGVFSCPGVGLLHPLNDGRIFEGSKFASLHVRTLRTWLHGCKYTAKSSIAREPGRAGATCKDAGSASDASNQTTS